MLYCEMANGIVEFLRELGSFNNSPKERKKGRKEGKRIGRKKTSVHYSYVI